MNELMKKLNEAKKSEKGFTLVELLVVILIIGILIAIAVPAFLNQGSGANDAGAKTYVDTAYTALKTSQANSGGAFSFTAAQAVTAIDAQEGAGYSEANATVPSTGTVKVYVTSPTGTTSASTLTLVGVSSTRKCTASVTQSSIGTFTCADR